MTATAPLAGRLRRALGTALGTVRRQVSHARTHADAPQAFAPGHFYSPVPNVAELERNPDRDRVWPAEPGTLPGIDMREPAQLSLLRRLSSVDEPVWSTGPAPRYDPDNDQFPPQDARTLFAMIRLLRPAKVVEVGCGWSTTVLSHAIRTGGQETSLTSIDPYPRDFVPSIPEVTTLRAERVELTPLEVFTALGAGDVLFIDSSHVSKTGSDVSHLFGQVLPLLADGVVVHVHDIFLPEDYPPGWVRAGFGWNEQYVVQAFLSGHERARVLLMNHWLAVRHHDAVCSALGPEATTGSSLWFVMGSVPPMLEERDAN